MLLRKQGINLAQHTSLSEELDRVPIVHRRYVFLSYRHFDLHNYSCANFDINSFKVVNYYGSIIKLPLI